jgi:hypothetical protein
MWPDVNIDAVTLGLLGIAVLPWLQPLLKSVELPDPVQAKHRV